MPIYEFRCSECGHLFEELVYASTVPECPACASRALEKQLSAFAVGKSGGGAELPPACHGCPAPSGGCGMKS